MKFETLGIWCKWLEKNFSPEVMIPTLPVIIRIDGNNFSKWTTDLEKPFDANLNELMTDLTKALVKETNAIIGYTQSDEITLILYSPSKKSAIYNDGKKQKILSKLTGFCVTYFNNKRKNLNLGHKKDANFDCRIYQTPTLHDAAIQLLWRENDATKNSISMLAQSLFPTKELDGLHGEALQDKMMLERNVNWNDLEPKYKRGTYVKRIKTMIPFTKEELVKLPPLHQARKNPGLLMERNFVDVVELPIFSKITNKEGVVFFNEEPKVEFIEK